MMVWIVLLILSIAVNVYLWRRLRRSSQNVEFLFNAVDNGDYAFRFSTRKGRDDKWLNASLNRVKEILQHARDEQGEREKYYEVILDAVDTGILVVDETRELVLRSNKAARQMLHRETITHIDQVAAALKAFSVRESYSTLKGRKVKIIVFSDIHGELANQEVDAWVKLIRVLTHEIMNSLTPVISLTQTLLPRAEGDVKEGLQTINRTSEELKAFVENYRQFTHVPQPKPALFYVGPFLQRMENLAASWMAGNRHLEISVEPKDLLVYADEGLVSRVMSNLLKNAVEAAGADGHIAVRAYTNRQDAVVIDVCDDGEPIPDDIAAQIFTPFFTTKKGGNGIGLSISRQIMRTMGGMLEWAGEGKWTIFRLTFP